MLGKGRNGVGLEVGRRGQERTMAGLLAETWRVMSRDGLRVIRW